MTVKFRFEEDIAEILGRISLKTRARQKLIEVGIPSPRAGRVMLMDGYA